MGPVFYQSLMRRAGLSNYDVSYEGDYYSAPVMRTTTAYCASVLCVGGKSFSKVKKEVPIGKTYCPDCGSALVYKREERK